MIRYIKYLFLIAIVAVLLTLGLANRQEVTLTLLTPELAELARFNWSVTLPLYMVVFGGLVAGLRREVVKLKGEKHEGKDEVLALLEEVPAKKAG